MCRREAVISLVLIVIALRATPFGAGPYSSAQSAEPGLALVPSANPSTVGLPVTFNGTALGIVAPSVTCDEVAPDGAIHSDTVNVSSSQFGFAYTFETVGNWTVFCYAGSSSSPLALSANVTVVVANTPAGAYFGIPVLWLGALIFVVSALSLAYLVFEVRRRAAEEEIRGAAGPSN